MILIDEILDELTGSQFFTKLDFKAGFHQIRMAPKDEFKLHLNHIMGTINLR
jgi:hypothetical protein